MMTNTVKNKIIVGMSGGVDSSVAALLLKQQGYDVHGVFMQNWEAEQDDPYCTASVDLTDAKTVCDKLNIPLTTVNFAKKYWDNVFTHFLNEYAAGRTPNPDILCNKEIKFKAFLNYALDQGADYIATGHYARIQQIDNTYQLVKGIDPQKDQTYFLYTLQQQQLAKSLFPIGELEKKVVRQIANDAGFINHAKKDSTGICFIGERRFKQFLQEYLLAKPGNIEDINGNILGQHDGLMFHTLGQRQGLGIGGQKHAKDAPWYVVKKDIDRNVLIAAQDGDHPLLLSNKLVCNNMDWVAGLPPSNTYKCAAKIRYRQQQQTCTITKISDDEFEVFFDSPQRAIAPGQSVVFYDHDICLGGGVILPSLRGA